MKQQQSGENTYRRLYMQRIVKKQLATFSSNTARTKYNVLAMPVIKCHCPKCRNFTYFPTVDFFWKQSCFSAKLIKLINNKYSVKSARIWSYSVPYFIEFELNTERYGVFIRNAGKYEPE